jgi:hypothetical protein
MLIVLKSLFIDIIEALIGFYYKYKNHKNRQVSFGIIKNIVVYNTYSINNSLSYILRDNLDDWELVRVLLLTQIKHSMLDHPAKLSNLIFHLSKTLKSKEILLYDWIKDEEILKCIFLSEEISTSEITRFSNFITKASTLHQPNDISAMRLMVIAAEKYRFNHLSKSFHLFQEKLYQKYVRELEKYRNIYTFYKVFREDALGVLAVGELKAGSDFNLYYMPDTNHQFYLSEIIEQWPISFKLDMLFPLGHITELDLYGTGRKTRYYNKGFSKLIVEYAFHSIRTQLPECEYIISESLQAPIDDEDNLNRMYFWEKRGFQVRIRNNAHPIIKLQSNLSQFSEFKNKAKITLINFD